MKRKFTIYFPQTEAKLKETEKAFYQVGKAMISVSMSRLDQLMDLVGEMVIAEAMVTQNPEIRKLELESFEKPPGVSTESPWNCRIW